ncbi:serine-rich adhesin for platelets-like [Ylistrum balloti]|uniref:serine-rich adhesin for platelets-like n=1 Tax=Ylistrum balloti TaxID=509963 RepID=UPI002905AEA4|nr:serine-rich adhesin for platelets-like [Ylistrum balloti]
MDPNHRNAQPMGAGMSHMFPVAQGAGYELPYGQVQGFQQTQNKPFNIPGMMGNNAFIPNYPMMHQGQGSVLANVQGGMPTAGSGSTGTLPSMGTFVGNFNQATITMGHCVLPNTGYKGLDSWPSPSQQSAGTVNALPSFGHFLMHQPYQQSSTQQQQQHQQHQLQQHQLQQQIFQTNQNQNRFPSALIQHGNLGQFVSNSSSVSGMIANLGNQPQSFSSVNMKINMSANLVGNFSQFSNTNVMGCQNLPGPSNPCGTTVLTSSEVASSSAIPCPLPQLTLSSPPIMSSHVAASCNQVTSTTSSVITITSTTCTTPVMAHMHNTSITPAVVPSTHITMATSHSNISNVVDRKLVSTATTKKEPYLQGCDYKEDAKSTLQCSSKGGSDTPSQSSTPSSNPVIVPFGWRRVVEEGAIVYYSPSNTKLSSTQEIGQYLSREGTCKCGLECPVLVEKVFSFDITIQSRQWTLDVHCAEDLTKLCNHKRKIIAMATFHNSRTFQTSLPVTSPVSMQCVSSVAVSSSLCTSTTTSITTPVPSNTKKESKGKKKKGRSGSQNPYDRLLVSELLAQREKLKNSALQAANREKITSPNSSESQTAGLTGQGGVSGTRQTSIDPFTEQNLSNCKQDSKSPGAQSDRSCVKSGSAGSDPSDDLGPISSSKMVKLDFSHGPGNQEDSGILPGSSSDSTAEQPAHFLHHQNQLTVQTVFSQEHLKEQVFIQQSPTNPLRNSPGYGFIPPNHTLPCGNFGSNIQCGTSPVNVPQNMGVVVQGVHQANFPVYQLQNTSTRFMNQPLDQNHIMASAPYHMNTMHGMGFGGRPPYSVSQQQSMYHPPNPVFQSVDPLWTEKKKSKPKKSKPKKEKQKMNSVFESDTPPPNVDVSQLHDQGRGPIPKVKSSSSFLENPTAFLAEQTALISNSMTSTLSSPTCSSGNTSESASTSVSKDGKNDTVDGDVVVKAKSMSQTSSSSVMNTTSISLSKPIFTSTQALAPMCGGTASKESSSFIKSSQHPLENAGIFLKLPCTGSESHIPLPDTNQDMFTKDRCESLSPDSGSESLVFTETITPSSVVHHTPSNTEDDTESKNDSQSKDKTFLIDKNVATSQGFSGHSVSAPCKTGSEDHNREKSSPLDTTLTSGPRFNRNVGSTNLIQQMLGHHSSTEFPASNLLSAAARAQMVQQQHNHMNIMINQQQPLPNIQISQSFPMTINPASTLPVGVDGKLVPTSTLVGAGTDCGPMVVNQSLSGSLGIVSNPSHSSSIVSALQSQSSTDCTSSLNTSLGKSYPGEQDSDASGPGTDTISKILAQPVNGINTTALLKQGHFDGNLMKHLGSLPVQSVMGPAGIGALEHVQTNSVNTPMPPISLPLVTAVTNSLTQVIPAIGTNGSQNLLSQQAVMNLFNNLGLNTMQNNATASGQGTQMVLTGQVLPQDNVPCLSLVNNTVGPNTYLNGMNQSNYPRFIGCNNIAQNIDLGNMVSSQRNLMDPNVLNKAGPAMTQLIPTEHQGGTMQMKSTMTTQPEDLQDQVNKMQLPCEQVLPSVTTSAGQMVLLQNMQMPLLQVLNANQMSAASNPTLLDKTAGCSIQQQPYPIQSQADIQALIGQLQAGLTQVGTPLNMMNVQQVWNNLTTGSNLTAMQLQTLQLQQQLLQQIQQLQGMQTLISQFNMQSNPGNPISSVTNKTTTTTVSNGLAAVAITTGNSAETCLTVDGKTFLTHPVTGNNIVMPVRTAVDMSIPDLKIDTPASTVVSHSESKPDSFDSTFERHCRKNSESEDSRTNVSSSVEGGNSSHLETSQHASELPSATSSTASIGGTFYKSTSLPTSLEPCGDTLSCSSNQKSITEDAINSTQCSLVTTSCISEQDVSPQSSNNSLSVDSSKQENENDEDENLKKNNGTVSQYKQSRTSDTERQLSIDQSSDRVTDHRNSSSVMSCSESEIQDTQNRATSSCHTNSECDNLNPKSNTDDSKENCANTPTHVLDGGIVSSGRNLTDSSNFEISDGSQQSHPRPQLAVSTVSSTVGAINKTHKIRQKSSPEHDPSIAEKPKEANLPSDVVTAVKSDLGHRVEVNFFQANHLMNTVELSSERAQKAADALTLVNRVSKRSREIDTDSFDDEDSSSSEISLSSYPHNFAAGDLVWGQIRGFPSWPGKVVDEKEVKEGHTPDAGKCWVQWFGDHTFTEVEPDKLKSLSEGLEAHHRARKKYRKGRKMNSNLEAAIHEAMTELDRQAQETESKIQAKTAIRGKTNKKRKAR